MEEFTEGVRDLHQQVRRLDTLLHERTTVADLSERRADAAHATAEETRRRLRWLLVAGLFVALVWTPVTAYGAVWTHEKVRNNCYPTVAFEPDPVPIPASGEPWYCGMFPGTDHPE